MAFLLAGVFTEYVVNKGLFQLLGYLYIWPPAAVLAKGIALYYESINTLIMSNKAHTVLITGASEGIGMEMARIHASWGDHLILVARRGDRLDQLKLELETRYGIDATVIVKDLTTLGAVEEIFADTEKAGLIVDILVNNAGFGHYDFFADSPWEKEERMIALNITALTYLTKLYLSGMVSRGYGRIMQVASVASFFPGPLMSVYFATKAYVLSFSEALASELKGTGVTCTALCPGPTQSGFQAAAEVVENQTMNGKKIPTSAEVAAYGYRAMMGGKRVAVHGFGNRLMALAVSWLPRGMVADMVKKMQLKK